MSATTTPTYTPVPMVMESAARNRARLEAMLASGKSPLFTALVVWNGEKYEAVRFILDSPHEEERPIFQRNRNYRGCRALLRSKIRQSRMFPAAVAQEIQPTVCGGTERNHVVATSRTQKTYAWKTIRTRRWCIRDLCWIWSEVTYCSMMATINWLHSFSNLQGQRPIKQPSGATTIVQLSCARKHTELVHAATSTKPRMRFLIQKLP